MVIYDIKYDFLFNCYDLLINQFIHFNFFNCKQSSAHVGLTNLIILFHSLRQCCVFRPTFIFILIVCCKQFGLRCFFGIKIIIKLLVKNTNKGRNYILKLFIPFRKTNFNISTTNDITYNIINTTAIVLKVVFSLPFACDHKCAKKEQQLSKKSISDVMI
jgi:hypothetical protein